MAAPSLPALAFGTVTKAVAAATLPGWLDALYEALLHLTATATYDDGATVPANAQWVVSRYQNTGVTEAVYCVPAATSPIAGKVVMIWAGATSGTHSNVVMASPDTYANSILLHGMYVASAGQTVSASDYSAWDAATPFTGGTGRFTGYVRVSAATTWNRALLFASAEYLCSNVEIVGGTTYMSWGGSGVRAPDDNTTDSESGLSGRVFDFGCSGSGGVASATFWNSEAASYAALMADTTTSGRSHWFYLLPGASTIRSLSYRSNINVAGALCNGDADNCLSISGIAEPDILALRDVSGAATDGRKIGRHRAFHFGPRRTSGSILSYGATKVFVAFGQSTASNADAICLPY